MSIQQQAPAQHQERQPGRQHAMRPQPETIRSDYRGSGKLEGRVAIIAGGDSGIGRSAAVHFAREGADLFIVYLDEDADADETRRLVLAEGRRCQTMRADLSHPEEAKRAARLALEHYGHIDILVHSVAQQYPQAAPEDITPEQLAHTFANNFYSAFFLVQAVAPHLQPGSAIVLTGSVTGVRGNVKLVDYASTKGALHTLNYSLAQAYAERGIRVNLIAPGPIWTPLIPSSFNEEQVGSFGKQTLMKRPGQPSECGPAYVFLASNDASYVTGQIVHVNGGGFIGD